MDDTARAVAAITAEDVRQFLRTLPGADTFDTEDGRADAGELFLRWRFGREDAEAGFTHAHFGGERHPLPPFWVAWQDGMDDLLGERGGWRRGTRLTFADALRCLARVAPYYPPMCSPPSSPAGA